MTAVRERIHQLVDAMPETELSEIETLLEERKIQADPFLRALANAPEDDEAVTEEEEIAVRDAYADIAAGRVVSHEEVRRRLFGDE